MAFRLAALVTLFEAIFGGGGQGGDIKPVYG